MVLFLAKASRTSTDVWPVSLSHCKIYDWLYDYDIETKAQSSQWKHPKKARRFRPNVKALLTVLCDWNGVLPHAFWPQRRMLNKVRGDCSKQFVRSAMSMRF